MRFFLSLMLIFTPLISRDFVSDQLKHARVRTAKAQKDSSLSELFNQKRIKYPSNNIFIRVFKSEAELELWAFNYISNKYDIIKTYEICALSGNLGPKRRRGDLQIPEGFYHISLFNPVSNFYLSLKLNYPNDSDKKLGYKKDLGGDIFIHGDCVTIGCIPITNDKIKELYWIAVLAKENGQNKIPVHIFPSRLNKTKYNLLINKYSENLILKAFWQNIKEGYDIFEKSYKLPKINIDPAGKYLFRIDG